MIVVAHCRLIHESLGFCTETCLNHRSLNFSKNCISICAARSIFLPQNRRHHFFLMHHPFSEGDAFGELMHTLWIVSNHLDRVSRVTSLLNSLGLRRRRSVPPPWKPQPSSLRILLLPMRQGTWRLRLGKTVQSCTRRGTHCLFFFRSWSYIPWS